MIRKVLFILNIFTLLICTPRTTSHANNQTNELKGGAQVPTDFLLCRQCGADLASAQSVRNLLSPAASNTANGTLFGLDNVQTQTLVNPAGVHFELVTAIKVNCAPVHAQWYAEHSWYPGYAWKQCICDRCGLHLGWAFEPLATAVPERSYVSSDGFYAIILDSIISELYSDSLIIAPKWATHKW